VACSVAKPLVDDAIDQDGSSAQGLPCFSTVPRCLDDRVLLCGHTTQDFDPEWDLPSGLALPDETLADALDRIMPATAAGHRGDSPLTSISRRRGNVNGPVDVLPAVT
jgi:hypothetical protein